MTSILLLNHFYPVTHEFQRNLIRSLVMVREPIAQHCYTCTLVVDSSNINSSHEAGRCYGSERDGFFFFLFFCFFFFFFLFYRSSFRDTTATSLNQNYYAMRSQFRYLSSGRNCQFVPRGSSEKLRPRPGTKSN